MSQTQPLGDPHWWWTPPTYPTYPAPTVVPTAPWVPNEEVNTNKIKIVTKILKGDDVNQDQDDIAEICDELKEFLQAKNRKYGSSALNPSRIFSRSDSVEQIKVRIDDKLTRLQNAQDDEDEDVVWDLLGYLVLLRIAMKRRDDLQTIDLSST